MDRARYVRRGVALLVTVALVANVFVGVAAAETRAGGTVTVEAGETVDGLTAFGGTVVVRGTVAGDLGGMAGSVVIEPSGVVTGDVAVTTGNLRIAGRVGGDVEAAAGSVTLEEGAVVAGSLRAGAGSVVVNGRVGGDAVLGTDSVTLGQTADVVGDLRYERGATFRDEGGTVGGAIVTETNLGVGGFTPIQLSGWLFTGYAIVVNLVVGAILLAVLPGFSRRVTRTVARQPIRSIGVGLGSMVAVPVGLLLVAVTIVGIPLAIVGVLSFAVVVWIALLYGRIAVAAWALGQADVDNRWLALVVGIVGFGLLGQIPILGGLLSLGAVLLGLGAIALSLWARRRELEGETGEPSVGTTDQRDTDSVAGP